MTPSHGLGVRLIGRSRIHDDHITPLSPATWCSPSILKLSTIEVYLVLDILGAPFRNHKLLHGPICIFSAVNKIFAAVVCVTVVAQAQPRNGCDWKGKPNQNNGGFYLLCELHDVCCRLCEYKTVKLIKPQIMADVRNGQESTADQTTDDLGRASGQGERKQNKYVCPKDRSSCESRKR